MSPNAIGFLVCAVLLIAVARLSLASRRTRRETASLQKQLAEMKELNEKIEEMKESAKRIAAPAEPVPQPFVPPRPLTADQRAEALGMLRAGIGIEAVSATLCLPRAEMALLQKVQTCLGSAAEAGTRGGSLVGL